MGYQTCPNPSTGVPHPSRSLRRVGFYFEFRWIAMKIDVQEAQHQFSSLLQHVAAGGEVTITNAGVPVARLVPAEAEAAKATEGASLGSTQRRRPFTEKQGQYLAFISHYTKLRGRPPSEYEMQSYFEVTPPSVHQMVLTLERRGLIKRTPGQARSIHLLVPREELPDLM